MPTSRTLQHEPPADPKEKGPKPEFPQKPIDPPGLEAEMTPEADHGETSYKGLARLTDRAAIITGATAGSAGLSRLRSRVKGRTCFSATCRRKSATRARPRSG